MGKSLAKKVDDIKSLTGKLCVFACFTEETLVHTLKGLKQIKGIEIGDDVYSYDEDNDKITIRKVTSLFCDDVQEILEIETETEIIRTTRTHPFYVNGAYKDAEQIEIGENLFTKSGEASKVISINYVLEETKVYTFEVEEDHCYFVGEKGVLVLNACYHTAFFNAFPWLKGKVVIHHAVEQQVLKKWPGLFDKKFMHSLDNLRGIPKSLNNDLHLSKIRKDWNRFYDLYKKSGTSPTKQSILDYAKHIDKKYGHLFNPPL